MAEFERLFFAAYQKNSFTISKEISEKFIQYVNEAKKLPNDLAFNTVTAHIKAIFKPAFANLIASPIAMAGYLS